MKDNPTKQKLSPRERRFRIHAICHTSKGINESCKRCPLREHVKGIGWTIKGCVLKADEILNLAKHGYPWPPPHNKRQRAWRRRLFDV